MYKDNPGINHKSELSQTIWDLATAIKLAELSGFYEFSMKDFLFEHKEFAEETADQAKHIFAHDGCVGCVKKDDQGKLTEKRICRCMYYYNSDLPKVCQSCRLACRWKNEGKIAVTEYEYPTVHVLENVGGIDLIFDNKYGVEVKPSTSKESLTRMFAEILTYTLDADKEYIPAICFFEKKIVTSGNSISVSSEDTEQLKQFRMIFNSEDQDIRKSLRSIMRKVKVFYFSTRYDEKERIMFFSVHPIKKLVS